MVEEVANSDQDETVEEGLGEEHFVIGEVHQPYWQRFVLNMQCEPDRDQIDFDEPVHALGLVVHRNQPSQKKTRNMKQNETFLLKKTKGAIEYKRHCFGASNTYTLVQKREQCISTNDGVIHEFLGANEMWRLALIYTKTLHTIWDNQVYTRGQKCYSLEAHK